MREVNKVNTLFHLLFSLFVSPVKIPLDKVQETWEKSSGPFQIKRLAEHYGVFRDLFPMAYFLPQVPVQISYGQDNGVEVHYGNRLTPTEVCKSDRRSTVSGSSSGVNIQG